MLSVVDYHGSDVVSMGQVPRYHLEETPPSFEAVFSEIGLRPSKDPVSKKARLSGSPAQQRRRTSGGAFKPKVAAWEQPASLRELRLDTLALRQVLQTGEAIAWCHLASMPLPSHNSSHSCLQPRTAQRVPWLARALLIGENPVQAICAFWDGQALLLCPEAVHNFAPQKQSPQSCRVASHPPLMDLVSQVIHFLI